MTNPVSPTGVDPANIVAPDSVQALAARVREAHAAGETIAIGRGESRAPAHVTLALDRLDLAIDHCAGDLVATVPAGVTLSEVNATLTRNGQWLPLDPPGADRATIGAIVATNASGPRRHRFGSPRDLIIGIEVVLADGRLVKGGGRVVKNVAGYDLPRLMCGSRGSLAVITSATFKLSPIAAASRTVVIGGPDGGLDAAACAALIAEITLAPLTPSTVEIESPRHRLLVRFETTEAAAASQAASVAALAARHGTATEILAGDQEEQRWRDHESRLSQTADTRLKLSVLPDRVLRAIHEVLRAASAHGVAAAIDGRAALGVLSASLTGSLSSHRAVVAEIRRVIAALGGTTLVERTSADDIGDRSGHADGAWPAWTTMRAVKDRFDPKGLLNPHDGPGGL